MTKERSTHLVSRVSIQRLRSPSQAPDDREFGADFPAAALEALPGGEVAGGGLLARRLEDEGAAGP